MTPFNDKDAQACVESVAQIIRQTRISQNVSVSRLAEQTGLSASVIERVERGDCSSSLLTILKITEELNLSLASILIDLKK